MADNKRSTTDEKRVSQTSKTTRQSTNHNGTQANTQNAKKTQMKTPEEVEKAKARKAKKIRIHCL